MNAFLVVLPSGKQIKIEKDKTVIGRNSDCDVENTDERVSRKHCEIEKTGINFTIKDLGSSNGTFVNGKRIDGPVRLRNNDTISLGQKTAAYQFRRRLLPVDRVLEFIKKPKTILIFAGASALAVGIAIFLVIVNAGRIDVRRALEKLQARHGEIVIVTDADFISALEKTVGLVRGDESFSRTIESRRQYRELIEGILEKNRLPADFSFIPWAESHYNSLAYNSSSQAAGMWQLVSATARQYGLRIEAGQDERFDPLKSTQAAALYLKDLVSIFGKDSFLLVLAAYNAGDNVILYGLKQIQDPVRDRNFWYLYKNNLIPDETKQYVMKILALMIVSADG